MSASARYRDRKVAARRTSGEAAETYFDARHVTKEGAAHGASL